MINWQQLRADLGGKWFLERKSLVALVPFLIATSVLSAGSINSELTEVDPDLISRYLKLIVANLISIAICWLYLELAGSSVFARRAQKPVAIYWVLIFGASVGFLKGYTTGYLSYLLGSELVLETAIGNRVITTTFLGLWTVPLVALAAATYERYKSERELLLAERIEAAMKQPSTLNSESVKLLSSFVSSSKDRIAALRKQVESASGGHEIANDLRSLIETWLRPISQQIWEEQQGTGKRSSGLTLYALSKNPFPLQIIGAGFLVGLLPINLNSFPLLEALLRTAFTLVVAIVVYAVFRLVPSVGTSWVIGVFITGNITASASSYFLTSFIFGDSINPEQIFVWLALFLWLAQLSFYGSIVTEVVKTRADIRGQLRELIGETGLQSEALIAINKLNNREFAQYVHSNLQNRLLARAIKLEKQDLTPEEINRQLSEVEEILEKAVAEFESGSSVSFDQQLGELASRWKGFLNISFGADFDLGSLNQHAQRTLFQLVNEAISNSQRHGLASKVDIEFISRPGEILLTVQDDGLGPRVGKAGLGTELFTAVAGKNWSLSQSPEGGSQLTVRLRL